MNLSIAMSYEMVGQGPQKAPHQRFGSVNSPERSRHFAGAVIYRLVEIKGKNGARLEFLMVTYKSKPDRPPCFKFPGGGEEDKKCPSLNLMIEETPETTFLRELKEETGLSPVPGCYEKLSEFPATDHTRYFYLIHKIMDIPELALQQDATNLKVGWHGLEDLVVKGAVPHYHRLAFDCALERLAK